MKRLATQLSTVALLGSTLAQKAFAQLTEPNQITDLSENTDVKSIILTIITVVLDFVLILAVLFVIIAGVRLVVSGGDEGQKDQAKKTIIYVIAGIVVVLFARAIVVFVKEAIGN